MQVFPKSQLLISSALNDQHDNGLSFFWQSRVDQKIKKEVFNEFKEIEKISGPQIVFLSEQQARSLDLSIKKNRLFVIIESKNKTMDLFDNPEYLDREDLLVINSQHGLDNFDQFLNAYFLDHDLERKKNIFKKTSNNLKKALKELKNLEKIKWPTAVMKKFYTPLDELKEDSLSVEDRLEFEKLIVEFNTNYNFFSKINFISFENIVEVSDHSYVVDIDKKMFATLELIVNEKFKDFESYLICTLVKLYSDFEKRNSYLNAIVANTRMWATVFSKIPYPMGLFSLGGELIHHNPSLTNMSITAQKILNLENNSTVNVGDLTYKVIKKVVTIEAIDYLFVILLEGIQNLSSTDTNQLGIITSSVAHELNNPLAGILAAIALLELEDEISDELKVSINEMKQSATRCKHLVETFLGFSRANLNRCTSTLKECLEQALNLLRFRMAESNTKINLESLDGHSSLNVNSSMITMVFYLLFGELLTAYSHFMLLTFSGSGSSKNISINCDVHEDLIEFSIFPYFDFVENLNKSKLMQYLLRLENFKLNVVDNKIFINRTTRIQ